jgi:hypothetical protein
MGIFASKPASEEAPKKDPGNPQKPTKPAEKKAQTKPPFREEDFDARLPRMQPLSLPRFDHLAS